MDREYADEQVRSGDWTTLAHAAFEPEDDPKSKAHLPLSDILKRLKETDKDLRLLSPHQAGRVATVGSRTVFEKLRSSLLLVPSQEPQLYDAPLEEEAGQTEKAIEKSLEDARVIARKLNSEAVSKEPTYERYRELLKAAADEKLTAQLLLKTWQKNVNYFLRSGTKVDPIDFAFASLASGLNHRMLVKVGSVDDFADLACVKVLGVLSSTSAHITHLKDRVLSMSINGKHVIERQTLLTSQSSGTPVLLDVAAVLALRPQHSQKTRLTLQSVVPLDDQSADFRGAHERARSLFD